LRERGTKDADCISAGWDSDGWDNLFHWLADHWGHHRLDSRKDMGGPWIRPARKHSGGASVGSFVGGFLFGWLFGTAGIGGWITAILGAIVLLVIAGLVKR